MTQWLFFLKASRPGLWFQTVWLYLLPAAGTDALDTIVFWVGLAYCAFPLNFLIYGWNDMVDTATDALNPRKDSFLWGARGTPEQLQRLPLPMALAQAPFWLYFIWRDGWWTTLLLVGIALANALYNLPQRGWRGRPPLELVNALAMLLILPLSAALNGTPPLSPFAYVYLAVFCLQAHLIGEVMDLEPDRASGRATTALLLGRRPAKLVIMGLVIAAGTLLWAVFHQVLLACFLYLAALWLVYDLAALDRKPYSRGQFTLMGIALNLSGYGSIAWLWLQGGLR